MYGISMSVLSPDYNFSLFPTLGNISDQQTSQAHHVLHSVQNYFCQYEPSSPTQTPCYQAFHSASFTPAKFIGALRSIPQDQAKINQLIEEDNMNNCERSLISKCPKSGAFSLMLMSPLFFSNKAYKSQIWFTD